jgi:hypothetical protein
MNHIFTALRTLNLSNNLLEMNIYIQVPWNLTLLYNRGGQLYQRWQPPIRRQQSARAMSYSSNHSFCKCLLSVAMLSKNVNTEMKMEDVRQWEEEFVFVERNLIEYFVLKLQYY